MGRGWAGRWGAAGGGGMASFHASCRRCHSPFLPLCPSLPHRSHSLSPSRARACSYPPKQSLSHSLFTPSSSPAALLPSHLALSLPPPPPSHIFDLSSQIPHICLGSPPSTYSLLSLTSALICTYRCSCESACIYNMSFTSQTHLLGVSHQHYIRLGRCKASQPCQPQGLLGMPRLRGRAHKVAKYIRGVKFTSQSGQGAAAG